MHDLGAYTRRLERRLATRHRLSSLLRKGRSSPTIGRCPRTPGSKGCGGVDATAGLYSIAARHQLAKLAARRRCQATDSPCGLPAKRFKFEDPPKAHKSKNLRQNKETATSHSPIVIVIVMILKIVTVRKVAVT